MSDCMERYRLTMYCFMMSFEVVSLQRVESEFKFCYRMFVLPADIIYIVNRKNAKMFSDISSENLDRF